MGTRADFYVGTVANAEWLGNNNRTKLANKLERYNKWRRGAEDIEQPNPTELGILIDEVIKELRQ